MIYTVKVTIPQVIKAHAIAIGIIKIIPAVALPVISSGGLVGGYEIYVNNELNASGTSADLTTEVFNISI